MALLSACGGSSDGDDETAADATPAAEEADEQEAEATTTTEAEVVETTEAPTTTEAATTTVEATTTEAPTTTEAVTTTVEATTTTTEAAAPAIDGGVLFEASCSRCHSSDGSGGIGPDIREIQNAGTVSSIVTSGRGRMPSFSTSLNSDEINAIAEFVLGL